MVENNTNQEKTSTDVSDEVSKTAKEQDTSQDEDALNKKVGDIEAERLKPGKVMVDSVSIQLQMKKGTDKPVGKLAHVMCKHPDREELIKITKVLFRRDEKDSVKESGLWMNYDKEGNIQKDSSVAVLINHNKVSTLRELEKKMLDTELNEAGYLCFKAY